MFSPGFTCFKVGDIFGNVEHYFEIIHTLLLCSAFDGFLYAGVSFRINMARPLFFHVLDFAKQCEIRQKKSLIKFKFDKRFLVRAIGKNCKSQPNYF